MPPCAVPEDLSESRTEIPRITQTLEFCLLTEGQSLPHTDTDTGGYVRPFEEVCLNNWG